MRYVEKQLEDLNLQAQKAAAQLLKQAQPILREMQRMNDLSHFQMAMREAADLVLQMNADQALAWSRVLQQDDIRSILAESFKELFPSKRESSGEIVATKLANKTLETISDRITETRENGKETYHLELTADGRLRNIDSPKHQHKLSLKMVKLISALRHRCIPTSELTAASGYSDDKSTRQAFQKLKRFSFTKLGLPIALCLGEKDTGYRLARCIHLKSRWRDEPRRGRF